MNLQGCCFQVRLHSKILEFMTSLYEFWEGGIQFITSCLFTMPQKLKGHACTFWQAGQVSTHAERNRTNLWPYNEGQWSLWVEKLSQSSHAIDKGAGTKIMRFLFVFYRNHLFFIQPKVLYSGACMLLVFVHNAVHYKENEGPRPPSSFPSAPEDVCPWALSLAW